MPIRQQFIFFIFTNFSKTIKTFLYIIDKIPFYFPDFPPLFFYVFGIIYCLYNYFETLYLFEFASVSENL